MSIELIRVVGMYRSKRLWDGEVESKELDGCSESVTDDTKYLDVADDYIPLRDFNILQAADNYPAQAEEWLWREVNHKDDCESLRIAETGSEEWFREFSSVLNNFSESLSVVDAQAIDKRLEVWRSILDANPEARGLFVVYAPPETDDEAQGVTKASEVDW